MKCNITKSNRACPHQRNVDSLEPSLVRILQYDTTAHITESWTSLVWKVFRYLSEFLFCCSLCLGVFFSNRFGVGRLVSQARITVFRSGVSASFLFYFFLQDFYLPPSFTLHWEVWVGVSFTLFISLNTTLRCLLTFLLFENFLR